MRLAIDDLPSLSASRLRALGEIRPDAATATVQFPDGEVFTVGLQHVRFPNGGCWSFFVCSCGRRCRTLRLYNGALACKHCLEARGFRYRVEDMSRSERAAHVAERLATRLASPSPARLKPHLWGTMERRSRLEAALREASFVWLSGDVRGKREPLPILAMSLISRRRSGPGPDRSLSCYRLIADGDVFAAAACACACERRGGGAGFEQAVWRHR